MLTVRETIIKTFISLNVELNEGLIDKIEEIVIAKQAANPINFAYCVARNKAVDAARRVEKNNREKLQNLLKNEKRRQYENSFNSAKDEFWLAAERAIGNSSSQETTRKHMNVLWERFFQRKSYALISESMDVKNITLKKWAERGRKSLEKYASQNLLKHIFKKEWIRS